jgi:hypothetical protein
MKRNDILEKEAKIKQWISEHRSKAYICMQLRCKHTTLEVYLAKLGIVYEGNKGSKGRISALLKPAVSYLYKGSRIQPHRLKLKLIRDGIKLAKCDCCQLERWFDKPIPLELHHINGNRHDNRLENLNILCPNCHALTDNHAGKALKRLPENLEFDNFDCLDSDNKINHQPVSVLIFDSPDSYAKWQEEQAGLKQLLSNGHKKTNDKVIRESCLYCGKALAGFQQDTYCSRMCSTMASRRVERPSKEELEKLVWTKPTSQLAKEFGVSDKAIEKWCHAYCIQKPSRGYWTKQQSDQTPVAE